PPGKRPRPCDRGCWLLSCFHCFCTVSGSRRPISSRLPVQLRATAPNEPPCEGAGGGDDVVERREVTMPTNRRLLNVFQVVLFSIALSSTALAKHYGGGKDRTGGMSGGSSDPSSGAGVEVTSGSNECLVSIRDQNGDLPVGATLCQ